MRRSMARIGARAALAAWLGLLCAASAQADPTLFASIPLITPGAVVPLGLNGETTLTLVLDPGGVENSTGTLCETGNGDNVCGLFVEFKVVGDGDLTLSAAGFTSLVPGQLSKHAPNAQTLRVAIVTTGQPLSHLKLPLGTLAVTSGPRGGTLEVSALQTVDASLDLRTGAVPRAIAVPEPGFALGLASGVTALGLLSRRRAQRGGVR